MSGGHYLAQLPISPAYAQVSGVLAEGGCVVLDGGVATELQRIRAEKRARRREPWGTWALFQGPMEVLEVHRRYVASGCDVISTNTWSVLEAADESLAGPPGAGRNPLWLDAARMGVRLARQAIAEAGREQDCATAFCVNSRLLDERASGRLELLSWVWQEEPPDLVILETIETVPDRVALETIEMVAGTGLPVWVAFRRLPQGMADVEGHVMPDAEPQAFRRALDGLASAGVTAVLVNCVPARAMADAVGWLHQQTMLPVGCYPNLGHVSGERWEFDSGVGTHEYARLAASWVRAGAQIVGGCCGVTPQHVAALREVVAATAAPVAGSGG